MKYAVNVSSGHLRVRQAPSLASAIVRLLDRGEVVDVTSDQSRTGWAELMTGGWVSREYLTPVEGEPPPQRLSRPPNTALPRFQALWDNYPAEHAPEAVKRAIGGKVDAAWIVNTCTIRLSRAFNYAGHPIPAHHPGLNVVIGEDGKAYAFRVSEMRKYLEARYGCATYIASGTRARMQVAGHKGVIMFDVRGWSDATGHFDLWNGSYPAHAAYFDQARHVLLWSCT